MSLSPYTQEEIKQAKTVRQLWKALKEAPDCDEKNKLRKAHEAAKVQLRRHLLRRKLSYSNIMHAVNRAERLASKGYDQCLVCHSMGQPVNHEGPHFKSKFTLQQYRAIITPQGEAMLRRTA